MTELCLLPYGIQFPSGFFDVDSVENAAETADKFMLKGLFQTEQYEKVSDTEGNTRIDFGAVNIPQRVDTVEVPTKDIHRFEDPFASETTRFASADNRRLSFLQS